ncbi:S1 RNA-binding domain-containing protein 1 [Entelurus aequoreus]|uniref:S1 RNA-binding domain-containing protein 1 n=1 Tax=Entelurus aequoreus TaxID=161455 RepID=UPI002B1E0412|nr:S1 RNA-binding domain-containing protein 1 [Entelurus aequoreus]
MNRRPRATVKTVNYGEPEDDWLNNDDANEEEWRPPEQKAPCPGSRTSAAGEKQAATKRTSRAKEPKVPNNETLQKPATKRKAQAPQSRAKKTKTNSDAGNMNAGEHKSDIKSDLPASPTAAEGGSSVRAKEERVSFTVLNADAGPSFSGWTAKKEEELEDFTYDEPALKKQKTGADSQTVLSKKSHVLAKGDLNMNWDTIELLSTFTCVERWVCANVVTLLREENTVPFIVRYRKEMINHMDADAVRDVQLVYEDLCTVAKKTQSVVNTLKKDGVLNTELDQSLRSCRSLEELDHVYTPYKKGCKVTKVRKAKALGLEAAATALMEAPHNLDLRTWVKPGTEGLSSVDEVATGTEHILAYTIAKDPETLSYVKTLCENSLVTLHSSVTKAALKEKEEQEKLDQDHKKLGHQKKKKQDIDKFQLYFDFTSNIQRIQPHQTLAINRGEGLKFLTVKVNIPDRVKTFFTGWCINTRWKPKTYAREEHQALIKSAVDDSYKRLVLPFLTRMYRTKLTTTAEKESVAMFVRNLRQRLLMCPVRGCVMMGVDPGFTHGCKVAVLSPTGQILHTDVVYLHSCRNHNEADKLRHLIFQYSCSRVVIGNGTACRETESFFADLIARRFFHPLDVSYCITNEAGASIYSVSPEAVKEMPDLDPNLRSAVSIGRRVQDPLAELVKIDPKHIGIGTYQHDVSSSTLKAALDSVVQECVSFVGVDINICSETLMRHVAGLNAGTARNIAEWREQNGRFVNREQLKLVKGIGPKSYQQCAGFIRINQQTMHSARSAPPPAALHKPAAKKVKGKSSVIPTHFNPLDQTCIHPESYDVAQRFLCLIGGSANHIGSAELQQCVNSKVGSSSVEELSKTLGTTPETLQLIIDGFTQPPGFDIRQDFGQEDFKRGVVSIHDLQVGTVLTGRVDNTSLFGAFVDIGVGRDGLIHKSNITLDKLPISQRRRSLALGPGQRVEVRVLNVDAKRGRIGLDLIRVLQ